MFVGGGCELLFERFDQGVKRLALGLEGGDLLVKGVALGALGLEEAFCGGLETSLEEVGGVGHVCGSVVRGGEERCAAHKRPGGFPLGGGNDGRWERE